MIKATTGSKPKKTTKGFPKIMQSETGIIVLFKKENEGVCIVPNDLIGVGSHSDQWDMKFFEDYNEPITIQNA